MTSRRLIDPLKPRTTPYHTVLRKAALCVTANWAALLPEWVIRVGGVRGRASLHVRFTPKATELLRGSETTRCAMCGRLRVGKGNLHVASPGRCSHVFGLLMRFT